MIYRLSTKVRVSVVVAVAVAVVGVDVTDDREKLYRQSLAPYSTVDLGIVLPGVANIWERSYQAFHHGHTASFPLETSAIVRPQQHMQYSQTRLCLVARPTSTPQEIGVATILSALATAQYHQFSSLPSRVHQTRSFALSPESNIVKTIFSRLSRHHDSVGCRESL